MMLTGSWERKSLIARSGKSGGLQAGRMEAVASLQPCIALVQVYDGHSPHSVCICIRWAFRGMNIKIDSTLS